MADAHAVRPTAPDRSRPAHRSARRRFLRHAQRQPMTLNRDEVAALCGGGDAVEAASAMPPPVT
ncbi:hypothetical protein M8494_27680 [Serratia ureilytica]